MGRRTGLQKDGEVWAVFRAELTRWLRVRGESRAALADYLNAVLAPPVGKAFTEDKISAWGRTTTPSLTVLGPVGRFLRMNDEGDEEYDPTYLLRRMGMLEDLPDQSQAVELAYRIQKLMTRLERLTDRERGRGRSEGTTQVVRAALARGIGAAVHPAVEGPGMEQGDEDYLMHVGDRIDLRRVSVRTGELEELTREEVWAHGQELREALRSAGAVQTRSVNPNVRRWFNVVPGNQLSQWTIAHVGAPSRALTPHQHPGIAAVAVSALTPDSWASNVAFLAGLALGYGHTSVWNIAREISGDPVPPIAVRNMVHDQFLSAQTPRRRVWSFVSPEPPALGRHRYFPFRDVSGALERSVWHFRLVEDDEVLRFQAQRRPGRLSDLQRAREEFRARCAAEQDRSAGHRVVELPITRPPGSDEGRGPMWTQTFECVRAILVHLQEHAGPLDLRAVHLAALDQEPTIAPSLLRWLADHGTPGVARPPD
ncbi:hypothetical protein [Ornithinicoccus hortensis]|uniref:Uncharacterized protein n=1 Tax=Ornithinicoccus hortensis TaxID=82346 RepID=A0A542YRB5_9MICO|nr:hypothetical protein [Ornithinicoccus hortensis]TQL50474.1 hypothetical protein FB467_1584 [Ornithinicoccus hortensis]